MEEIINYDLIRNVEACYFNIPHIVYYSHIGTAVIAFVVGAYVFLNNRKSLLAKILFSLTVIFSLWTILDLVTWIHKDGTMIMFAWATLISMDMLVYVLSFYLLYVFLFKKDLGWSLKGLLMLAVAPTIVLASTTLNLEYFDA